MQNIEKSKQWRKNYEQENREYLLELRRNNFKKYYENTDNQQRKKEKMKNRYYTKCEFKKFLNILL